MDFLSQLFLWFYLQVCLCGLWRDKSARRSRPLALNAPCQGKNFQCYGFLKSCFEKMNNQSVLTVIRFYNASLGTRDEGDRVTSSQAHVLKFQPINGLQVSVEEVVKASGSRQKIDKWFASFKIKLARLFWKTLNGLCRLVANTGTVHVMNYFCFVETMVGFWNALVASYFYIVFRFSLGFFYL